VTNRLGTSFDRRSHRRPEGFVYVAVVDDTEAPLTKTGVWITRLVLLVIVAAIVAAALFLL
jgi:hypothetical protein